MRLFDYFAFFFLVPLAVACWAFMAYYKSVLFFGPNPNREIDRKLVKHFGMKWHQKKLDRYDRNREQF